MPRRGQHRRIHTNQKEQEQEQEHPQRDDETTPRDGETTPSFLINKITRKTETQNRNSTEENDKPASSRGEVRWQALGPTAREGEESPRRPSVLEGEGRGTPRVSRGRRHQPSLKGRPRLHAPSPLPLAAHSPLPRSLSRKSESHRIFCWVVHGLSAVNFAFKSSCTCHLPLATCHLPDEANISHKGNPKRDHKKHKQTTR